jgi:hypothetical protein
MFILEYDAKGKLEGGQGLMVFGRQRRPVPGQ